MSFRRRVEVALEGRHYQIERELGRGSMGRVYLARDLRHDRHVALKVLDPGITTSTGGARFVREIQIVAALQHPHILPLLDSGESDGVVYYIMPHVEGETLRDHLTREQQLSVEEAVRIAGEIGSALQYAHEQGIVHRDIKPDNILLSAGLAMVADFGIARALSSRKSPRATSAGLALGTPAYMSPEQVAGEEVDHRADIYALGAVLFEMIAGRAPFVADTLAATLHRKLTEPTPLLSSLRPGLPRSLDGVVSRALARDADQRFQSAAEFRAALAPLEAREALAGTPLDSPRLSGGPPASRVQTGPSRPGRGNQGIIWGGLVSIVVIVVLLLIPPDRSSNDQGSGRSGNGAGAPAADSVWGVRPIAGPIGAATLALPDADPVVEAVAVGLWDSVEARLGGRVVVQQGADSSGSVASGATAAVIVRGTVRRDGPDVVASFDWHEGPDAPRYWSESYHIPPGEPAAVRRAIVENLVRALTRLSIVARADSAAEPTP